VVMAYVDVSTGTFCVCPIANFTRQFRIKQWLIG
jgi:hypothetical protein